MTADANEQGTVRYMRCVSCGNMNPVSLPTCARCGKPLHAAAASAAPAPRPPAAPVVPQVMCPKCHKSFPAGSKFCGFCGTPLPAAPPQAATPPAPVQKPAVPPRPAGPPVPQKPAVPPRHPWPGLRYPLHRVRWLRRRRPWRGPLRLRRGLLFLRSPRFRRPRRPFHRLPSRLRRNRRLPLRPHRKGPCFLRACAWYRSRPRSQRRSLTGR